MNMNKSHIIIVGICSQLILPCFSISIGLQKQMSTAQTSQQMSQIIQQAAQSASNRQWIEINIDTLINQIEKDIRDEKIDIQGATTLIEKTQQALEQMPTQKSKNLADKLETNFKSLQLTFLKEQRAAQENIEPIIEEIEPEFTAEPDEPIKTIPVSDYLTLIDNYKSWQANDDLELPEGITSEQYRKFSAEIREIRETQGGDERKISKETYNFLKMLPNAGRIPV